MMRRPLLFIRVPCQGVSLEATFSMTGRIADLGRDLTDSGAPKYFVGKCWIWHGSSHCSSVKQVASPKIGVIEHLSKLACKAEALPKMSSSLAMARPSRAVGVANSITSSA